MLLLALLDALRPFHRWDLVVAHLHHQLRGPDADADRDLVLRTAADRGLRGVAGTADVRAARARGESLETTARRLRHGFLAATARELGASHIATAHHAGDQTELFLLRLFRGAGGRGLGGMNPSDPSPADPGLRLVRPLLAFAPDWLADAARELAVPWREDASNRDLDFRRNRVRHELVPWLESHLQPALGKVLERTRVLLRDDAAAVQAWAAAWLSGVRPGAFPDLPAAVQREILRQQLESAGVTPEFEWIEALRTQPDLPLQLAPTRRVRRDPDGLVHFDGADDDPGGFREQELRVALGDPGGEVEFGGGHLAWTREPTVPGDRAARSRSPGDTPPGESLEWFDAAALGTCIRLRHWRPGDRFQPIGLGTDARLQDLFTNARVPPRARRARVVAEAEDGRLFWVEGLRIGELAKQTPTTTALLAWRWTRPADADAALGSSP